MSAAVLAAALLASVLPVVADADRDTGSPYWDTVEQYRRGEHEPALARLAEVSRSVLSEELLQVFNLRRDAARCRDCQARRRLQGLPLRAAVLLHTDRAWAGRAAAANVVHLRMAALLLDAARLQSPETETFARRWWLVVTLKAFARTDGSLALRLGRDGLGLFPGDPDLLLAVGTLQEAVATPTPGGPAALAGAQLDTSRLQEAEAHLQAAAGAHPEPAEALLRLGRVESLLGRPGADATLGRVLEATTDARLLYLARLFLGSLEEKAGRTAAAARHYSAAMALVPAGQAARIALSHAQQREGDPASARRTLDAALSWPPRARAADPFWQYPWGHCRRVDDLLAELRSNAR
jgi:tetratricopeptide (TPR) repeat protein